MNSQCTIIMSALYHSLLPIYFYLLNPQTPFKQTKLPTPAQSIHSLVVQYRFSSSSQEIRIEAEIERWKLRKIIPQRVASQTGDNITNFNLCALRSSLYYLFLLASQSIILHKLISGHIKFYLNPRESMNCFTSALFVIIIAMVNE